MVWKVLLKILHNLLRNKSDKPGGFLKPRKYFIKNAKSSIVIEKYVFLII